MAIRKISDLPYLTEAQQDMNNPVQFKNFLQSSIELSYLSSQSIQDQTWTFASRQVKMDSFMHMLLADVMEKDAVLSGTKTFPDGVDSSAVSCDKLFVRQETHLSGSLICNEGVSTSQYTRADLLYQDVNLGVEGHPSGGWVKLHTYGYVDDVYDDPKSIVNLKFLRDFADVKFA